MTDMTNPLAALAGQPAEAPVEKSEPTPPAVAPDLAPDLDTSEPSDGAQRVPIDRFRAVTDENKTLRTQLEELNAWKESQEQAALSEVERERQAREKAEAALVEATSKAVTLERTSWVRDAALAANFTDPEDASLLLDLSDLADKEAAVAAVAALAERKPHLIGGKQDGPQAFGNPLGSAPSSASDDPRVAMGADLLRRIQGR